MQPGRAESGHGDRSQNGRRVSTPLPFMSAPHPLVKRIDLPLPNRSHTDFTKGTLTELERTPGLTAQMEKLRLGEGTTLASGYH